MVEFISKIFQKKEKIYCPHGWEITDKSKIPHIKTMRRISVCHDCATESALKQLGSGIQLNKKDADELRELINKNK